MKKDNFNLPNKIVLFWLAFFSVLFLATSFISDKGVNQVILSLNGSISLLFFLLIKKNNLRVI